MQIITAIEPINGQLKRTETILWPSSGRITKRIYDSPGDIEASDIIELRAGRTGTIPMAKPDVAIIKIG